MTVSDSTERDYGVNANSAIYYAGHYWNDTAAVRDHLNVLVSGRADREWWLHFAERVGRVFERALILNCGNGNVERNLVRDGVVRAAVGIDFSEDLLGEARREAEAAHLPLTYHQMDVNSVAFPDGDIDLVINVAAGHHIACIDRVFRAVCDRLPDDGWFVSWDYVGAHRNQYPYEAWDAAFRLNQTLPERFRQDLRYPHLPTMLATDPTEAIHSELIETTFRRYFVVDEFVRLGGELGYPLLTHNDAFWAQPDDAERAVVVETILRADTTWLAEHPSTTLFAYFSGRPDKAVLTRHDDLERWRHEEDEREARARANGGEYYARSVLQETALQLEEQRMAALHARDWAEKNDVRARELEQRLHQLVQKFPYRQLRRVAHLPGARTVLRMIRNGRGASGSDQGDQTSDSSR